MTDTTGALPPAGWYPDPYGAPFERWWDGAGWTTHTNAPEVAVEPTPEPVPYTPPVQADPYANFASPNPQSSPQPVFEQPAFEQPAYQQPAFEQLANQQPAFEQPAFEQPAYQQPAFEQPVFEQPVYQQPAFEQPVFEQPTYQAPEQPVYQPPAFETPAFETPAFETPVFAAPQAQEAVYQPPAENLYPENLYQAPNENDAVPARESYDERPFAQPAQQQAPVTSQPQAAQSGMPNPPSSFDFGFGQMRTGDTGMPSNASIPADGESGLFGSWEPSEYTEPPNNRAANAGLVLGILSFIFSAVAGVIGLVLSVLGLSRAAAFAREGAGPVGRGKAVAGIILSIIGSVASAALIIYGMPLVIGQLGGGAEDTGNGQVTDDGTVLTVNGGVPLAVGETGVIPLADSETPAITFVVTAITPAFECTAPVDEIVSAENGQFIAVAIDLTLAADYLTIMDSAVPLRMNQSDWIGYSADPAAGQVNNTDGGVNCIPAAEQFPDELVAGTTTSAVIVLDMGTDTASVSWAPGGVTDLDPGITRWEWAVPA